jgi:hypothetical protein
LRNGTVALYSGHVRVLISSLLVGFSLCVSNAVSPTNTSALWGAAGEKWSPAGRLPDFSFAGYRRGEEPYRIPKQSVSVRDFGARGDGNTDDTAAFKRAIAAGAGKVVEIPAGTYLLGDVLEIRASNLLLRGAGPDKTILRFTKPLEVLRPSSAKTDGGKPTSSWSWGGGLIMIGDRARAGNESPVAVEAPVARGAMGLTAAKDRFKAGDEVILSIKDDAEKSLVKYLYRDRVVDISGLNGIECSQVFRVRSARGTRLELDRGLRFELRGNWRPVLRAWKPDIADVGVEALGFEFPEEPYQGHFLEVGYNPVVINSGAAHCWLKDLRIWNADSGPYVNGRFCTVENIRLGAGPGRASAQGHTGHHGITLQGHDSLVTNFVIETQFIHDTTVQSAIGCVFCSGRAQNLNMDHHRWAPYENLFTDIDAGEGKRLFQSSGGGNRGIHTGAGATFWNIRTRAAVPYPKDFGPDQINLVGINMSVPEVLEPEGRWVELLPPGAMAPANLQAAMRAKRLGGAGE